MRRFSLTIVLSVLLLAGFVTPIRSNFVVDDCALGVGRPMVAPDRRWVELGRALFSEAALSSDGTVG